MNFSFVSCRFCSWKFLELAFAFIITLCVCNHSLKSIYTHIHVCRKLHVSVVLKK